MAEDRMAHATTLRAELRRARPTSARHHTAPPAVPPATNPNLVFDSAEARLELTQAAHAAQDEAARLVMTLPGYRAALLASISA
jgi:hypothetical protein